MFDGGPSTTTRLIIAVLLSLTVLTVDYRERHHSKFRSAVAAITYPLVFLADLPSKIYHNMRDSFASHEALLADNNRLHTENLKLHARLLKLDALEQEMLRLGRLLNSSFKVGEHVLISELVSMDLDPYRHHLLVNKGSQSGVYVGQPAVDANAIMGQVSEVTPWTATILLITDTDHSLPVQISRTGLRTIAIGTGKINRLSLPFIPNDSDIKPGDQITTSGLGGQFPSGYPVGIVDQVARNPGAPFTEATATPSANLDRAREVLLVWPPKPEDPIPNQVTEGD